MLDAGGRNVWSHVQNNYYFRVNHHMVGFFTPRKNIEGFVCCEFHPNLLHADFLM